MDDTLNCPICGLKMRTINLDGKFLHHTQKLANYAERTCVGMNHTLRMFTDKESDKVDFLSLSLNPKYSRFLEINFVDQRCRINCMKEGESTYIDIPKMIEPDFPKLIKLKEKVSLYVVFS